LPRISDIPCRNPLRCGAAHTQFSYADPITDADNFVGPSVTPIITSTITIEGRGAKLDRVSAGRPTRAFVLGPSGFLDVEGFFIHGGNGGIRGGGGTSECHTRNGVTTSGSEGNSITNSTPNNLDNPPCPGVVTANDPLLENLEYNPPGTTPTMMLDTGSPAIDAAVGAFPADDQRGILRPQGEAADIGAVELSSQPPTTTTSLAPATPNGANGWYVSAVGVTINATDPEQDVAQTRCVLDPASAPSGFADLPDANCALTSVSADGEHAIYAASIDDQGNAEDPVVSATFKLDGTDPTLSPSLNVPTPITVRRPHG
jgi:hypothetical protein